jgi:hypothetical protein
LCCDECLPKRTLLQNLDQLGVFLAQLRVGGGEAAGVA